MTYSKMTASASADMDIQRITRPLPLMTRMMQEFFMRFCKVFFKYYCPLDVIGYENIPLEPFIFCSNHSSHMDSAVLMMASGLPFQQCAMLAAQDYFFQYTKRRSFIRMFMNLIPIDRQASKESMLLSVKLCEAFLKQGNQNLIIYPEGTRSITGELQSFKKGSAWIAIRLQLPIVPVYIHGTFKALPKGRSMPKPTRLIAVVGKPLYPNDFLYSGRDGQYCANSKSYTALTQAIESHIRQLKEQAIVQ